MHGQKNAEREATTVVRPYQQGDQPAFQALNEAWIRRYFVLETKDHEILGDPEGAILGQGGAILFATVDGLPVGCCALIADGPAQYELSKMAVHEDYQGRGIGRKLIKAAIETAKRMGARRIHLETNAILLPALRLYQSAGFTPVPIEEKYTSQYSRGDTFLELWLH
ncbi:MAG TPA: GNAT family N-acetyltransferase [Acidobacteriaceae bacterium]|jgi:GNAT superfamily N-acetyltransferase